PRVRAETEYLPQRAPAYGDCRSAPNRDRAILRHRCRGCGIHCFSTPQVVWTRLRLQRSRPEFQSAGLPSAPRATAIPLLRDAVELSRDISDRREILPIGRETKARFRIAPERSRPPFRSLLEIRCLSFALRILYSRG